MPDLLPERLPHGGDRKPQHALNRIIVVVHQQRHIARYFKAVFPQFGHGAQRRPVAVYDQRIEFLPFVEQPADDGGPSSSMYGVLS